jgi:hypothetical protein
MQGGQIMDNAVCGGPDSGSGITSTNPPISAAALGQIKAIILMGSPRYVAGLSYNVGTCTAQGVSHNQPLYSVSPIPLTTIHTAHQLPILTPSSLPPVPAATPAPPTRRPRSKTTATGPIPTAAPATTPTCISSTAASTASRRSTLSRASSATRVAVAAAPPPLRSTPARPTAAAAAAAARLCGRSAEGRGGTVRRAARKERAGRPTSGTRSASTRGPPTWRLGESRVVRVAVDSCK